eukprot:CAMPEP_0172166158 /NCGR_PEP_ID=MMETSP1050-20130122/8824_1 /TAXON_ID=233186 /ORGANISM="Cryptomonas curvata, Strain CCAP979/52" /LENGTH=256 /DNA_ID=CAMNT_0012836733 /DNA_START=100 /DNA_END=871 /DNA_ORIENTATION=+
MDESCIRVQASFRTAILALDSGLCDIPGERPAPYEGTVFIAGCGTGEEVVSVSMSLPENKVEACDLAEGMVSLAGDLVKANALESRVRLFVGDATSVPAHLKPLSAVFSCFVLQQMPRPAEVLAGWTRALGPDGVLCVCYWPKEVESEGPWRRMVEIDPPKSQDEDWERDIPGLAVAHGAEVLSDRRVSHTIEWSSVEAFWDAMTLAGPWNARLLRLGEERMSQLRDEFLRSYGNTPPAPLRHSPQARILVMRRRS